VKSFSPASAVRAGSAFGDRNDIGWKRLDPDQLERFRSGIGEIVL
jgi:hypothetical protein